MFMDDWSCVIILFFYLFVVNYYFVAVAFSVSHFNYLMGKVGLRIRGALITVIYRKTLTLNAVTLKTFR